MSNNIIIDFVHIPDGAGIELLRHPDDLCKYACC